MALVSLDHLCFFELTPPELVTLAAGAGFDHVGLRLSPAAPPGEKQHPMLGDSPLRRETLARLRATGVAVFDFGVFRLEHGMDFDAIERVLETAAVLGAERAVVNAIERDPHALAALLHALCERARPYGVRLNLEPTPWSPLPGLAAAVAVVQACDHPLARLMIDTLHMDRLGVTPAGLASVPAALVDYVQVCDAVGPRPADFETMIHQARNERAFPGDGTVDVLGLVGALADGLPLSLEAPVASLAGRLSLPERALRARQSMDRLVAALAQRRRGAAAAPAGDRPPIAPSSRDHLP